MKSVYLAASLIALSSTANAETIVERGQYLVTTNITSDPEDGLGRWTDEQIKVSITEGKRPDGTALNRIMAFDWYKGITQPDLDSIVAYLRTIPPQKTP